MTGVKRYLFLILLAGFLPSFLLSQQRQADSLKGLLLKPWDDINRAGILYNISVRFQTVNSDSALRYNKAALALYEKKGFKSGIAQATYGLGVIKNLGGEYDSALYFFKHSLSLNNELGLKKDVPAMLNSIGLATFNKGQHNEALNYYYQALKANEQVNDTGAEAAAYGNIGVIHYLTDEFDLALKYYNKALLLDQSLGNHSSVARHLGNMANVYFMRASAERNNNQPEAAKQLYARALETLKKALEVCEKQNNKGGMAFHTGNIGNVLYDQGDTTMAIEYYKKALEIDKEVGNYMGVARHLGNIGWVYIELKDFRKAEEYTLNAIRITDSLGSVDLLFNWYENLSILYEEEKDFEKALGNYKTSIALRDSFNNILDAKKTLKYEMNYEIGKREEMARQESVKQAIIRNVFIGGFVFMLIFGIVVFRSYRNKKKANLVISEQKKLVDEKQKEILDSIRYAKRIQQSLLPTEKYMERTLSELVKPEKE